MKRQPPPLGDYIQPGVVTALVLTFTVGAAGQRRDGAPAAAADQEVQRSINDGVYSDTQAERGRALYLAQCASCHGDDLEGMGFAPGLLGTEFLSLWTGQSLRDLYSRTRTTMPEDMPGSLSPAETIDIVSYLFEANGFPSGPADLEREMLETITITGGDATLHE